MKEMVSLVLTGSLLDGASLLDDRAFERTAPSRKKLISPVRDVFSASSSSNMSNEAVKKLGAAALGVHALNLSLVLASFSRMGNSRFAVVDTVFILNGADLSGLGVELDDAVGAVINVDLWASVRITIICLVHFAALFGFALATFTDSINITYSINPLKRKVAMLMIPVNMLAFSTYLFTVVGVAPYYITSTGTYFHVMRYMQWSVTTPILVLSNFMLAGHGLSREAVGFMLLQFVQIISGLLATVLLEDGLSLVWGAVMLSVSFATWAVVIMKSYRLQAPHPKLLNSERSLWRALQRTSVVVWSVFPAVWLASHLRFISPLFSEILLTVCDFLAKMVYTVVFSSQAFMSVDIANVLTILESEYIANDLEDSGVMRDTLSAAQHALLRAREGLSPTGESSKLQRSFLKCMTHEMRNPLNIVVGHSKNILQNVDMGTAQRQSIEESLQVAHGLLQQVDMAVEFSEFEQKGFQIRNGQTNIIDILDRALEDQVQLAHTKKLEFMCFYPPEIIMQTDCIHLHQCLLYLLDNAIKFAEDRSTLTLRCYMSADQSSLTISIVNGRSEALDPCLTSRILQPFGRCMREYRAALFPGVGLGLPLVHAKVKALRGQLSLGSFDPEPSRLIIPLGHPMTRFEACITLPLTANDRAITARMVQRMGEASKAAVVISNGFRSDVRDTVVPLAVARVGMTLCTEGTLPLETVVIALTTSEMEAKRCLKEDVLRFEKLTKVLSVIVVQAFESESNVIFSSAPVSPDQNPAALLVAPVPVRSLAFELESALRVASRRLEISVPRIISTTAASSTIPAMRAGRSVLVLSVDDSKMNLRIVDAILKKLGCEVVTAENGLQAVQQIEKSIEEVRRFDCVLMDLRMPVMDGLEAVRTIRELEQRKNTPRHFIAALTANTSGDDRREAFDAGCDEFFTKPIKQNDIQDMMLRTTNTLHLP